MNSSKDRYIIGPIYDNIFIIWSPILFLALAALFHYTGFENRLVPVPGEDYVEGQDLISGFAYTFTMAHLVAVFFRSHLNRGIFRQFPYRFTLIPILFYLGLSYSENFYVFAAVFITWFDVYHSSLQTFGLGRIYDMRAQNDLNAGRRLDYWLSLFTYAGPILAGASLYKHIKVFNKFERLELHTLASIPGWAMENHIGISAAVIGSGVLFLIYYLRSYWKLYQNGYQVSWQKVCLHLSLAACSIYTWGFNSFGQAFFIMESYHALQYFALVWWSENKNMQEAFRTKEYAWGKIAAFFIFVGSCLAFGLFAYFSDGYIEILLLSEFLHYWYDGFVWSVRKKQVA